MPLAPGTRLGPYEILSPIGSGGMGEVWKARDTRLNRHVAIKTSAAKFSERFEREARAIAALNHPHICQIYDVGPDYLVMELVDGVPVKGPLPLDQALRLAIQLASALEAAHRKTITHRDLKPANVLNTKSGIKVLDFGLAKFEIPETVGPDDATLTKALTQEGAIVGTLQYMSPEQLHGKPVDTRADIFAFGCVLYEMLTGRRAFDGSSTASVIAAVLEREPPPVGDVASVTLDRLLKICLAKDPDQRWQSATDLKRELEWIATGGGASVPIQTKTRTPVIPWAIAVFGLLALAAVAFIHFRETPSESQPIISTIAYPEDQSPGFLAFSPDGSRMIVRLSTANGKSQLFLRSLDSPQLQPMANTENVRAPFWSPDGKSVGFFAGGKLKTIPVSGGAAQELCDVGVEAGGAWSRDGVILFGMAGHPLTRVSATGGPCTELTKPTPGTSAGFPEFLPDGKHFFYVARGPDMAKDGVYVATLDDPAGRRLLGDTSGVIYTPPPPGGRNSFLLLVRAGRLMAQPFDADKLQLAGDPFQIADRSSGTQDGTSPLAAASANGILAYVARNIDAEAVWTDRTGKVSGTPVPRSNMLSLSPDGRTVAASDLAGATVVDLARGSESPLPGVQFRTGMPVWSSDSRTMLYVKNGAIYRRDSSGGAETLISQFPGTNGRTLSDWTRDGKILFYTETDPKSLGDIWYLPDPLGASGPGKPVKFLATPADESQAQLSPDGHLIAYNSNESGGTGDIYIRQFPSGTSQWKVSTNGATDPRWSADGKEIYFLLGGGRQHALWAASVRPGHDGAPEIGVPQKLFETSGSYAQKDANSFSYSVAPGGRFLFSRFVDDRAPVIYLIANWWNVAPSAK